MHIKHVNIRDLNPLHRSSLKIWPTSLQENSKAFEILKHGDLGCPDDASLNAIELNPGAVYPAHAHDQPEFYYVLKGQAKMTWGDDTFIASSGSAIYTPPGVGHRVEAIGEEPFVALVFWWAPGGDKEAIGRNYRFLGD